MKFLIPKISLLMLLVCALPAFAKTPWTFLVYIAADNNLNPDADMNIAQMVKVGSNQNINVLVYLNIKRDGEQKKTQRFIIKHGSLQQIGVTTREDSGDERTLIKALQWAIKDYPADHIAVGLWDHGSGSLNRTIREQRGVCYDDTTGNYLTDLKYKRAFDAAVNQYLGGKKIDLIFFDACLMADIEVAHTLQPYAHYMVSSQETVPGPGFNYTHVLEPFLKQSLSPAAFASWMVSAYDSYYKPTTESYTLSATDLSTLSPVTEALNAATEFLSAKLAAQNGDTLWNALVQCTKAPACPHFTEPTYIDLYSFCLNMYSASHKMGLSGPDSAHLRTLAKAAFNALNKCTMINTHSKDLTKARGMSIYFPDLSFGIEPSYYNLYWSTSNPEWLNFLGHFASPAPQQ